MIQRMLLACFLTASCLVQVAYSADPQTVANLLANPTFSFRSDQVSPEEHCDVAYWNTANWGDVSSLKLADQATRFPGATGHVLRIKPGKKVWQFTSLPDLKVTNGDTLSLAAQAYQQSSNALHTRICAMLIESEDGSWKPSDFGLADKRTFAKHGRGELIRSAVQKFTSPTTGIEFQVKLEGLRIDSNFEHKTESSSEYRNIVGVLVEFENASDQDVWIHSPSLVKGVVAMAHAAPSRSLPEYYRRIPKTLKKLASGQPIYVLTLGSSIDRGSANPPLYLYDENPSSDHFKDPLTDCRSRPEELDRLLVDHENRPDLLHYIGWWQHYHMYTGRMRLELMRKFNLPVDKILLNVMACDGSSIGESHSGFQEYADLKLDPSPNSNGHAMGKTWRELYPALFPGDSSPAPDLVVFGHGHNEHIDRPDEIAAYEGAIRWFQRRYPDVEFVTCMWIRDKGKSESMTEPMQQLCDHYGIPFIDAGQMLIGIEQTTNKYALAPDGGHPGAASHYLWSKQIEQVFEIPEQAKAGITQKHLPKRMNPYSYGWEGNMIRHTSETSRFVDGRMMILDDNAFNLWADNNKELMQLNIDGSPATNAGHGRHSWSKPDPRNSTFVHGRLSLGDRHIIEIVNENAKLIAVDCKVAPNRTFVAADSDRWNGTRKIQPFESAWGAPYGDQSFGLTAGHSIEISVEATDLSVAYLDQIDGGTLIVEVDGKQVLSQATDIPFKDSKGRDHFTENRKGVNSLSFGRHDVRLLAKDGDVIVLGLFSYDDRSETRERI